MGNWIYRSGLGQDHHRYLEAAAGRGSLRLAGIDIPAPVCFDANSDGDVILHALINACSGLSGRPFLGPPADALCRAGITDSRVYWQQAWAELQEAIPGVEPVHVSVSLEASRPKLFPHLPALRASLAACVGLPLRGVGLTATTGENLTGMGKGEGMAALVLLTVREPEPEG